MAFLIHFLFNLVKVFKDYFLFFEDGIRLLNLFYSDGADVFGFVRGKFSDVLHGIDNVFCRVIALEKERLLLESVGFSALESNITLTCLI